MKYILKNKEIELTQEEVKEIIEQNSKSVEVKKIGIAIKNRWTGKIIFQSSKETIREAIIEKGDADLRDADLRNAYLSDAYLRGADLLNAYLSDAELNCAKFYGRGGSIIIKKANLEGFLGALGFKLEE